MLLRGGHFEIHECILLTLSYMSQGHVSITSQKGCRRKMSRSWIVQPGPQFTFVTQSCPTLCDPMDCSTPDLSITNSRSLLKLMFIESVMPSNHLILWRPLLLLPSIFPSIRVFSNESLLHIRWPKYLSFSFSISPSNEYSELILGGP